MRHGPGDIIHGKYRLVRPIGDGGMGSIFEARHEALGTSVAIKFLHTELARRPSVVARFLQEARVSAALRSPHVVRVSDMEPGPPDVYLVMELLHGETLQALLERCHRLEPVVALDIALQTLAGLEAAHAANVVHRDLKPENVFLQQSPQGAFIKLLDFGIAKLKSTDDAKPGLTRPGVVMGTPEYMAPEQAFSADTVDARADIYALGVMLYEMLSGQRPVTGDDPRAVAQAVLRGQATPLHIVAPGLPHGLVGVIHRAMAPDVAHRFGSAAQMRDALLPFAHSISPAARASLPGYASAAAAWTPAPDAVAYGPPNRGPEGAAMALPAPRASAPSPAPSHAAAHPAPSPVWNPPTQQQAAWSPPASDVQPPSGWAPGQAEARLQQQQPFLPTVATPYYGAPPAQGSTVAAPAYGGPAPAYGTVAASAYEAPPGFSPNAPSYVAPTATPINAPPRRARGISLGWLAFAATLLGGVVVAVTIAFTSSQGASTSEPAPPAPAMPPPLATRPAASSPPVSSPPIGAPTMVTPPGVAPPAPPQHSGPAPKGAGGAGHGGSTNGLPPFPSSFPGLPSSLPTVFLPLPSFPGFPGSPIRVEQEGDKPSSDTRKRDTKTGAAGAKSEPF